ncbi:sensor histidine kinase [Halodesulfurarchaeum sp.]|uniref:sensor histidine kinase n=1 Tax=Halodesulfurarchaeum sp. TaxID=1980530 RepID=UPI002FC28DA7
MTNHEATGKATQEKPPTRGLRSAIVDRLPIAYQSLDGSGTILEVNQTWLDTLGYERAVVTGADFTDFLSAHAKAKYEAQFPLLLSRGRITGVELELRHAAGHLVPVAFQGGVEYDDAGEVKRTYCQFYEIEPEDEQDGHLQAQNAKIEALHSVAMDIEQTSNERAVYETLVETAREVLDFDIAIADAVEDEYLVTQAVSTGVTEEDYFARVPLSDDSKLGTRVYRTGEPSLIQDLQADDHSTSATDFRSVLTVPIGTHGVFQAVDRNPGAFDETDKDLAELLVSHIRNALDRLENIQSLEERTASLSRERNRLEAIFEAIPEPVAHVRYKNQEPIIEAVNSAFEATFGYDSDSVAGESINELIVPEDGLETAQNLDRAAETADVVEQDVERITTDGIRTFRLRSSVLNTGGEPETLAIYVDLTEEIQRKRELERENDRLEQFASIVSHDLRSPLTVASGRLGMVMEDVDSPHLEEIDRAIDRMDAIIDDVLTLTRKGQTVSPEETEPVDLADLAETSWEAVDSPNGELRVVTMKTVLANRSRLRRVFENLFWNAVEHGGPTVTVTVGDLDEGFFVADDGTGIPPEEREQVFESGYTTTRDGTGLGLDIVADIIEAHGWTVDLTATESGGARFEIRTV